MTTEEHKKRHEKLHKKLDELLADWIGATEGLPSKASILDLVNWSHTQTENPDHDVAVLRLEKTQGDEQMKIQEHMEMLGIKVTDKVTGFKGVVTSISFDLYGCIQAIVVPAAGVAGKQEDSRWFDVQRLTMTGKKPVMDLPNYEYGYIASGRKGAAEKPVGRW